MAERLSRAGLRVTVQRRVVWEVFERGEGEHLGAGEVLERARRELPGLARATVYNALGDLTRAGLLRQQVVEGRGGVVYCSNLDPAHHHFHCLSCGSICDVHLEEAEGVRIRGGRGFVVDRKTVLLEGLCPACSSTR